MGETIIGAWEIPALSERQYYFVGFKNDRTWTVGSISVKEDSVLIRDERGYKRVSLPLALTGLEFEGPLP